MVTFTEMTERKIFHSDYSSMLGAPVMGVLYLFPLDPRIGDDMRKKTAKWQKDRML